jgi:hypothetical protein
VIAQSGRDPRVARADFRGVDVAHTGLRHEHIVDVTGRSIDRPGTPIKGRVLFAALRQSMKCVVGAHEAQSLEGGDGVGMIPGFAFLVPAHMVVLSQRTWLLKSPATIDGLARRKSSYAARRVGPSVPMVMPDRP